MDKRQQEAFDRAATISRLSIAIAYDNTPGGVKALYQEAHESLGTAADRIAQLESELVALQGRVREWAGGLDQQVSRHEISCITNEMRQAAEGSDT